MSKLFQLLFGIEPGETKPVLMCFILSFIWGISQVITLTAASTLFLDSFPASSLPYIYIANAIAVPVIGFLFIRLSNRFGFIRLFILICLFFIAALGLLRFLIAFQQEKAASFLLLIWYEIEFSLSGLLLWGVVSRLFSIRQSKRVFSPISIGSDLAVIIFGFLIPLFTRAAGVPNFIFVSIGAHVLAISFFIVITVMFRKKISSAGEEETEAGGDEEKASLSGLILKNRFILGILLIGAFSTINYYFVDNAFYNQAQKSIKGANELADFIGRLLAVISLVILLLNSFVTGRIIKAIGVVRSLLITPVFMGIGLVLFITASSLNFPVLVVFGFIVLVKVLQTVLMETVNVNVYFNLFQSLPGNEKNRATAISETFVSPIIGGLSGILLLIIGNVFHFGAREISLALLGVIVFWMIATLYTGRKYKKNLSAVLEYKMITSEDLPLNDPDLPAILMKNISGTQTQLVLYSMELLEKIRGKDFHNCLPELAVHGDSAVRKKTAGIYEKSGVPSDYEFLCQWFDRESDPEVKSAIIMAMAFSNSRDSTCRLVSLIDSPERPLRIAAVAGLMKYCGIDGWINAGALLESYAISENRENRLFAAECIGIIGQSGIYNLVFPLLNDPDPDVRETAIQSAGLLDNTAMFAAVFRNIRSGSLAGAVEKTLVRWGESIYPELEEAFREEGQSLRVKTMIIGIYGRNGKNEAIRLLKEILSGTNRAILNEALSALLLCHYQPAKADRDIFENLLKETAGYSGLIGAAMDDIGYGDDVQLVRQALLEEADKCRGMIFSILSFLYPQSEIEKIRFNYFQAADEGKKDICIELLENLLSGTHKMQIIPVLDCIPAGETKNGISQLAGARPLGRTGRMLEILRNPETWQNDWLKAAALKYLHDFQGNDIPGDLYNRPDIRMIRDWVTGPGPERAGGIIPVTVFEKTLVLRNSRLFKGIESSVLLDIVKYTVEINCGAGEILFSKGDMGDSLFFVTGGKVLLHSGTSVISGMEEGEAFGELSALIPETRAADVTCITDASFIRLDNHAVHRLIEDRIDISFSIIKALCFMLKDVTARNSARRKSGAEETAAGFPGQPEGAGAAEKSGNPVGTRIDKLLLLKSADIFSLLPDELLMALAALVRERYLKAGEVLFNRGDYGNSMYIIIEGQVKVHDGDITIARLSAGQIIGEMAVLSMEHRSASVTALMPTRLFKITSDAIHRLIWEYRAVTWGLIRVLVGKIRASMK